MIILLFLLPPFLAAAAFFRIYLSERRPGRIPVLLYHRLALEREQAPLTGFEKYYCIPVTEFATHMRYLSENHYATVSPDDLYEHLSSGKQLPPRPILITFDDGCDSIHTHALEILQKHHQQATVFVTTDDSSPVFSGTPGSQPRLTEHQMRKLEASGVHVASHGVSHTALDALSISELRHELVDSRSYLERIVERPVRYFAVPLSFYNRRVLQEVKSAGYRLTFTSDPGTNGARTDRSRLRRITVGSGLDRNGFSRLLQRGTAARLRFTWNLKRLVPRLIGSRRWLPVREALQDRGLGHLLSGKYLWGVIVSVLVLLTLTAFWLVFWSTAA